MPYEIHIKKAVNGEHFAKIVAGNNEIVMLGETWKNKSALVEFCENLGEKITENSYRVEARPSETTGKSHGVIVAGNNEIVMYGEPWDNASALEKYLSEEFVRNIAGAKVVDLSE